MLNTKDKEAFKKNLKENLGKTFGTIRSHKGLTLKYVSKEICSIQSLSNIEIGEQVPGLEKAILLLGRLNIDWEEFVYLTGDNYIKDRITLKDELSHAVKHHSYSKMKTIAQKSRLSYEKYNDIFGSSPKVKDGPIFF